MAKKNMVSDDVWDKQAELYELGLKHANEIARELGVSPQTVSRHMKIRGAVKGSMVSRSIQALTDALDRKAQYAALMTLSNSQRRQKVAEANLAAVGHMMAALLEADRKGDLTIAAPLIDSFGMAIRGKGRRRARN